MAKLSQLVNYLEKGYSVQCETGTTLHLEPGGARAPIVSTMSRFWPTDVLWPGAGLEDMRTAQNSYAYGVLFLDAQGNEYCIDSLAAIEEAIGNNIPHRTFGQLPPLPQASRHPIGPSEIK